MGIWEKGKDVVSAFRKFTQLLESVFVYLYGMRKSESEREKWKQNIDNICTTDIRRGEVN